MRAFRITLVVVATMLLVGGIWLSRNAAGSVDELGVLALGLTIIVAAAAVGGHLAARVGQAAVLGELLVGILIANLPGLGTLRFIGTDPYIDILARIGMLLLLFEVGVELSVRDLFAVGRSSMLVALIGTIASLMIGTGAAALLMPGAPTTVHVFLAAAISATSVGITARVLRDMGASRSREAQIILGAAIVDDVLALVVLGVVVAWFTQGQANASWMSAPAAALVMKTIGFLVLAIVIGMSLTPAWFRQAARLRTRGALLAAGLCFCFLLSWAASSIGLAALVGAFAAGLLVEDAHSAVFVERGERPLVELLQPMTSFLVPMFFVLVGFRVDLHTLASPALLVLPLALTGAAVLGKLASGLGVVHPGVNRRAVAAGMIPRGEVALVFATLGASANAAAPPILDQGGYTAIVTVVILTTLVTPPALKWALRGTLESHRLTRPAA